MNDIAIRATGLGKRYLIGARQQSYGTLRDTLVDIAKLRAFRRRWRKSDEHVWALKDVSFEVRRGDVLGVIGRNGAGKSTLLKILSRVTQPTTGSAEVHGRVGSLLEVGTGFHPELSGRENVFLNGAILGMRRAEIARKFDRIVEFAEVDKFIDTPVKFYSSGMYLRLAFAVAAHLEPSILMVDEVLAVGDLAFQRKCLGRMQEVGETGQTVIFVSHDMTAISRLATRSLILKDGQVIFDGPTEDALRKYTEQRPLDDGDLDSRQDRVGDGLIRMTSVQLLDGNGRRVHCVGSGDAASIVVGYRAQPAKVRYADVALDLRLTDAMGHPIATLSTRFSSHCTRDLLPNVGYFVCRIPSVALAHETYGIDLWLAYGGGIADFVTRAGELQVVPGNFFESGQEPVKRKHGAALLRHQWTALDDLGDDAVSTPTGDLGVAGMRG